MRLSRRTLRLPVPGTRSCRRKSQAVWTWCCLRKFTTQYGARWSQRLDRRALRIAAVARARDWFALDRGGNCAGQASRLASTRLGSGRDPSTCEVSIRPTSISTSLPKSILPSSPSQLMPTDLSGFVPDFNSCHHE